MLCDSSITNRVTQRFMNESILFWSRSVCDIYLTAVEDGAVRFLNEYCMSFLIKKKTADDCHMFPFTTMSPRRVYVWETLVHVRTVQPKTKKQLLNK